jgi:hypothetical protein
MQQTAPIPEYRTIRINALHQLRDDEQDAKTATSIHRRNRHPGVQRGTGRRGVVGDPSNSRARVRPSGHKRPAAATTASAFPTFVHLPADQAAHPNAAQEWWYVVGHLNAHGHRFAARMNLILGYPESPYWDGWLR